LTRKTLGIQLIPWTVIWQ